MSLGLIVSMYDETEKVIETIKNTKKSFHKIIVIQSNPGDEKKLIDPSLADHYELLPDLASSIENYQNERKQGGPSTIPARALSRNCSMGFQVANSFDVGWWVFIMGDVLLNNLSGIQKIIRKMEKQNKFLGITRPLGQTLYDSDGKLNHLIIKDTTTFTPTFFIVKSDLIQKGLFTDIKITNPFTSEQCFGDNLNNFLIDNKMDFHNSIFLISNLAYPGSIKGLKYNYPQPKISKFLQTLKDYF